MRIRPGRNMVRLIIGLAVLSPLTFLFPATVWVLLAALVPIGVLAVRDFRALKECFKTVSATRKMPVVAGRGVAFDVDLQIENGSNVWLFGEVRDVVPVDALPDFLTHSISVEPRGGVETVRAEFRIPIRGLHQFGPVWLRMVGSYGILEAQQSLPCTGAVKVLPESLVSRDELEKDLRAELLLLDKLSHVRQHGAGTEFESLSEFRQGDDPRRIDWRTTARYRRPIVRRYQVERHRDVMIVVDCGRLMGADAGRGTKLDNAVDAGLMLGRVALAGGDRCGLGMFDNQVLGYLSPVSGVPSLRYLIESMYDLKTRWLESDFSLMFSTLQSRQSKRSLIVILSDIVDVETSQRFRTSLASLARRHVVLFAALRTPSLNDIVKAPVETLLDGSRKAVAFRILREREQAIHSLRRSGVHVLDVEPSQLTLPLINQFVALRRQNLL